MLGKPLRILTVLLVAALGAGCARGDLATPARPSATRTISATLGPRSDPAATSAPAPAGPSADTRPTPTQPMPPSPPATGTGINGITVIDGGCPVLRADSPCPARPIAATLHVVDATTGATVTAITTSADGHFTVPTAAGRYLLHPVTMAGGAPRRPTDLAVTVEAGHYTTVTYLFDSGIR